MPASKAWSSRGSRILAAVALVTLAACSEDGTSPVCRNCEAWDQVTAGLARFPAPHPSNPAIVVFSTVEKTPGAPDANRQSDEDLWLTWIVSADDPAQNPVWQLTGDELGAGDNFHPRWSPAGDEIAFVHNSPTGRFEVWRLPVTPPASPGGDPVVGTAQLVALGRDPAWASPDRLVITRADKLYAIDLGGGAVRGGPSEIQLSFDPPLYASSDDYIDRHPEFAPDGGAVFTSIGRDNIADVTVFAYEIDRSVTPAETTEVPAFVLYKPPGAVPSYPVFEGADTLRTPALLRSLPVGDGGDFVIGTALDGRLVADTTLAGYWRRSYCDTTLTQPVRLEPSDADTLRFHFDVVRGTLRIRTWATNTSVFWTRADELVSGSRLFVNSGDFRDWTCLLSYRVVGGVPDPPALEDYLISASRPGLPDFSTVVQVLPGTTTTVEIYAPGPGVDTRALRPVAASSVFETVAGNSILPEVQGASLAMLRAVDDVGTVWRLHLEPDRAEFERVLGSPGLIQNPALSAATPDGVRYLAYATNEDGDWGLRVQRLRLQGGGASAGWVPEGEPVTVATPGSGDNLDCTRNVFHPRFAEGATSGSLRLVVAMSDCPDNGFEDLGFDDDPWAIGEIRLWEVEVPSP